MLALYDSGLGGLTVLRALRAAGVDQDILYFADQAHAPYGDRSDGELYDLLAGNLAWLGEYGLDAVVMACNTSCAVAALHGGFPAAGTPVLDLIANAAQALRGCARGRVAVIATVATVRSAAYRRAITRVAPQLDVVEIAAPELVPIVEAGDAEMPRAAAAVRAVCAEVPPGSAAIVYGCTHYPLLERHFALALGAGITRIDPAVAQAAAVAAFVADAGLPAGSGRTRYVTSGDVAAFERNIRERTGDPAPVVTAARVTVRR
jgi:glutamate racemase